MRVVSKVKRRAAIAVAVLTLGVAAAGCLPDSTGWVGPADPLKDSIFQELNGRRRSAGLADFGYSPKLDLDAQIWACIMAQGAGLRHQDLGALLRNPDHSAFWTLGENILNGPWYLNGPTITTYFMNSPPHRANILSTGFNHVGVGACGTNNGQVYVSLVFGGL